MSRFRVLLVVAVAGVGMAVLSGGRLAESLATQPVAGVASQPAASRPVASTRAAESDRRVLLHEDFEAGKGNWGGEVTSDNVPAGSKYALAAVPTETHWARRAAVGSGRTLRATEEMVLKFRYHISKDIPITIYIFDSTQKDNLRHDIEKPVVGRWTDVAVSINKDFRRNDRSAGKVQPGDALKGISFLAGVTGKDECEMVVDDVEVTGQE